MENNRTSIIREIIPSLWDNHVPDMPEVSFFKVLEKDSGGNIIEKYLMINLKENSDDLTIELSVSLNQNESEELLKAFKTLQNYVSKIIEKLNSPLYDPLFEEPYNACIKIKELEIGVTIPPDNQNSMAYIKIGPLHKEYSKLKLSDRIKSSLPLTVYKEFEFYKLKNFVDIFQKAFDDIFGEKESN